MPVVAHAAACVRGSGRARNEDAVLVAGPLLAVADGVGGAHAGDRASLMVVDALRRLGGADEGAADAAFKRALDHANRAVRAAAANNGGGMASTVVAARVQPGAVTVAHAGDSRAYLWRHGELHLLTSDDSFVGALIRSGKMTASDARRSPFRSIVLRAVGADEQLDVTLRTHETGPGDLLVLCSDGLWNNVDDETLERELSSELQPPELVARLVTLAQTAGSRDDISVVCALLG